MHVTFDQLDRFGEEEAPLVLMPGPAAVPAPRSDWQHGGGYGMGRTSPGTIVAILLAHVALLTALVQLDVVSLPKAKTKPLVVTLMPEAQTPPPAPPEQELKPIMPVKPVIVAPQPVVPPLQPAPVQIATVRELPPQATVVAPAPPAPAAPPASVTPPDGSAASLKNPAPRYPIESRRKREEGTVRLRVVITEDGRVKEIVVARSSGFDRLDEAALDTVRKWKFRPGLQAGVAVEAVGFLSIPFKIAA